MQMTSDQLSRLAAFVDGLEQLSRQHGIEVAALMGTGLIVDGKVADSIELTNRSTWAEQEDRAVAYVLEQAG